MVALEFKNGKLPFPVHLSGGNEEQLIKIFEYIAPQDWVFAGHRNHYHALLKGIPPQEVMRQIHAGRSMTISSAKHRFMATGIVGGLIQVAVGAALAIKLKGERSKVWCFVGDGGIDSGRWNEAQRLADCRGLRFRLIVEDNDLSVETPVDTRWGGPLRSTTPYVYSYKRERPHVGIGKWVTF